ncbi:MAG: type II toxin-antitoxin system PemK/MazF family toxin [Actinomycetota bacterium]
MTPKRGEIWWAEMPTEGRRPVLILTRDAAIPILRRIVVVPITRTIRGVPTEVPLDEEDGMRERCAASLDNIRVADRSLLTQKITDLRFRRMMEICAALKIAVDC